VGEADDHGVLLVVEAGRGDFQLAARKPAAVPVRVDPVLYPLQGDLAEADAPHPQQGPVAKARLVRVEVGVDVRGHVHDEELRARAPVEEVRAAVLPAAATGGVLVYS
jgi:hypothetical protein